MEANFDGQSLQEAKLADSFIPYEFFWYRVDPFWKAFMISVRKQELTNAIPFCKKRVSCNCTPKLELKILGSM